MNIAEFLSASGVLVSVGYYGAATLASLLFARRSSKAPPPISSSPPRVAVLKPLHGERKTLFENLRSYLKLDYPRAEFLFGVHARSDPAARVVEHLLDAQPRCNAALVVGEEPDCANHKIAKVIRMAAQAHEADVVTLSDADIAVEPHHLRHLVSELMSDERTGIVTCAYRAVPVAGMGARFEALSVNTDFAPQVLLASSIEPMRYALGATIAIRRAALESIGGFDAIKDRLGDDFWLGRLVTEHGWRVRLSNSLVTITTEEETLGDFWNHQLRWARTYRTVRPLSLAMIVTHGPFWSLLYLLASGFSPLGFAVVALVVGARIGMASLMMKRVLGLEKIARDAWLTPIKDLMMTGIWFASLASNKVIWAGRRFEILPGGTMREVKG
jgi:ceramide glucosyltransferase